MTTERDRSLDLIKLTALVTMTIDHLRHIMPEYQNVLVTLGRWAFPLFAFLIAVNTFRAIQSNNTNTLKRYFINLVLFALISEIPYRLLNGLDGTPTTINVMPTLLLGLILIVLINSKLNKLFVVFATSFFVFMLVPIQNHFEYGLLGVLLIVALYYYVSAFSQLQKNLYFMLSVILALTCNLQYLIPVLKVFGVFSIYTAPLMISIIMAMFYIRLIRSININFPVPKTGKILWWFYPIHMLLIYSIGLML